MVRADYGCRRFHYILMLWCCIFAESGASPLIEPNATTSNNRNLSRTPGTAAEPEGRISYEQWSCGAFDFDKSLSYQMAVESCPGQMCKCNYLILKIKFFWKWGLTLTIFIHHFMCKNVLLYFFRKSIKMFCSYLLINVSNNVINTAVYALVL